MDFSKIFENFSRKKVLIVGDLVLDHYVWGNVNRISPEAPVPVIDVTGENFLLGGACNVANNISSLGGHAGIIGLAGNDRAGEVIRNMLSEKRVACYIFDDKRPTTVKTRVIAHNQQVVRFDREERHETDGNILRELTNQIKKILPEYDAVIISDYRKGVISLALIKEILKAAKPENKFVAVDPKTGHFHLYKNVSLITPNLKEAAEGSGIEITDEKSLIKAGNTLLKKLSCRGVLITRGEEGMSLFEKKSIKNIPTFAKHVYDVTGAGDTVIATFTLAYASGATMEQAAIIANHAAGIVVGEVGTAVTTTEKILKSFRDYQ